MKMVLHAIARHPQASPAVLTAVYRIACDTRNLTLKAAIAANANCPDAVTARLRTENLYKIKAGLLARPGISATEAIALIGNDKRLHVLRAATTVPDPDGILAEHLMAQSNKPWLLTSIMASPHTSENARVAAACAMLRHRTPARADVARACVVLTRHRRLVHDLLAAATSAKQPYVAQQLQKLLPPPGTARPPRPGTVTVAALRRWLDAPATTTEDVLAFIAQEHRTAHLCATVRRYDPDGAITTAALAVSQHQQVAAAVLSNPSVPVDVRRAAAITFLDAPNGTTSQYSGPLLSLLAGADADFINAVARVCRLYQVVIRIVERPELTAATLTSMLDLHGEGSHIGRVVAAHPNAPTRVRNRVADYLRGVADLTPAQRQVFIGADTDTDERLAWLQVAEDIDVRPALDVAAGITAEMLNRFTNTIWEEALALRLIQSVGDDAEELLPILVPLSTTFPGTLADLMTVASSIAA